MSFHAKESDGGGRIGELNTPNRRIETPILIPVLDLLTGPPGLERNGGIWRHCKEGLIRWGLADAIMVQAMHFVDFSLSKKSFREWFAGPEGTDGFSGWVRKFADPGKGPVLFVDSGGFKLLYNSPPDLSRFSIKVSPQGIFKLQTQYSADIVASLDYPFPPGLSWDEQRVRTRLNIRNALTLMKEIIETRDGQGPFPFLCVHGVDYESVRRSTLSLMKKMAGLGYDAHPFGLAIGSLVPIRNHDDLIFAIIRGVHDAIELSGKSTSDIPIHVFGVSSSLIPLLPAVGVDSFDSSTYAQAAAVLRYLDPDNFSRVDFTKIETLRCNCDSCLYLLSGGLDRAKEISTSKAFVEYEFGDERVSKARIIGAIAVHNWVVQKKEVERTVRAIRDGKLSELITDLAGRSKKFLRVVSAAVGANPELRKRIGVAESFPDLPRPTELRSPKVSLAYTSESFDLGRVPYLPRNETLLILACTSTKPYSESRSHRFIIRKLTEHGVSTDTIEIVTLSGLYGPVPRSMERLPQTSKYDFRLHGWNKTQVSLVLNRSKLFMESFGTRFRRKVAYVSSEPYRSILQKVATAFPDLTVLPVKKGRSFFYQKNEIARLATFLTTKEKAIAPAAS